MSVKELFIEGCKGVISQYLVTNINVPMWSDQDQYVRAFISSVVVAILHIQVNTLNV